MGNMGYCRFENTFEDLQDCYAALGEILVRDLSATEKRYAIKLVKLCHAIADGYLEEALEIELELKNLKTKQDGN